MINGFPVNGAAVNGSPAAQQQPDPDVVLPPDALPPPADPYPDPDPGITPPDPTQPPDPDNPTQPQPGYPGFQPIEAPDGYSLPWTAIITMAGVDVTARLTGVVRVDRSEGAAGIAEFELYYPTGTAVPLDLHGGAVEIEYKAGEASAIRLFTGWVSEPNWNAQARTMRIMASDRLQQRVEAMDIESIDALVGGLYSEDFFAPLDEVESHWRYAQDRLSTRTASLDCSALGDMRVTNWKTKPAPDYLFEAGSTVYLSADVKLAQPTSMTNHVELSIKYRYPRLWQASATYNWSHPGTSGHSGMQGFCSWRQDSTELPTIDMYLSAVSGGGFVPVSGTWSRLPASAANPCFDGVPWVNNQEAENLILGGRVVARKRWVQQVTETYTVAVTTAAGENESTKVISRISASASVEHGSNWASSIKPYQYSPIKNAGLNYDPDEPADVPESTGDYADEARRAMLYNTVRAVAEAEIRAAHRQTRVQWQCPTSMVLGIDTVHTLELDDQGVHARGKCIQRLDELNFESGSALTTLAIAITTAATGEAQDAGVPPRIGKTDPDAGATSGTSYTLPTQLGGRYGIPDYDEEKNGFSGNYSFQPPNAVTYPRRFAAASPDIPDTRTDERVHESKTLVRVAFAGDLLEI